ncbi:MAG: hypothetical protein L0Z50_26400 [Verrucomicrobiales bacterium]|nr:hypothetical protein [Verrucomicrobiales bacterium]
MKKYVLLFVALALTVFGIAKAWARDQGPLSVRVGYKLISGLDFKRVHDTHTDDRWLPDGDKHGSAGTTEIDDVHLVNFGLCYDLKLPKRLVTWTSLELGIGVNVDDHQNANDYREPSNAAFIFAWPFLASDLGLGLGYQLGRVTLGGEVRGGGVAIASGWDRYSSYDFQTVDWRWTYGAGPQIRVRVSEALFLEGGVLFGNVNVASVSLNWRF